MSRYTKRAYLKLCHERRRKKKEFGHKLVKENENFQFFNPLVPSVLIIGRLTKMLISIRRDP